MAPAHFFKHRNRPDTRCRLQDRHDLVVPKGGQWVRPPPATWRFLLRGQSGIILDPVAAGPAEAGLPGRYRRVVDWSKSHVKPHLVCVVVTAGRWLVPHYWLDPD